jgi:hypothetical protein
MDARIMRQSLFFLAPLVGLLVTTSGCATGGFGAGPHTAGGWHEHHGGGGRYAADVDFSGLDDLAEIIQNMNPEAEVTADTGGDAPADFAANDPDPTTFHTVPAWLSQPPPENTRPFDRGDAYGAMANVDLDACKADGLVTGYGRVVLGFRGNGAPASVSVEMPQGSTTGARSCVESAFGKVRVAPFDGDAVTVQRSFFVKA